MKPEKNNQGFVLTGVMMLLLIATLVGGAFLFSARNSFATVDRWRSRDECLLSAQSGLEEAKYELDRAFRLAYEANHGWGALDTLANLTTNQWPSGNYVWTNKFSGQPYVVTVAVAVASSANIKNLANYTAQVYVTNVATVTYGGVTRRVREVVRYFYDPVGIGGSVFDNVYYIDHQASFSGVNGDFNGDVRAAGNIDFANCSSLKLNGDVLAGGTVLNYSAGFYDWYNSKYLNNLRARPLLWTDQNTNNASTYWPQGYSGDTARYNDQPIPAMPYIGPLSEYEAYAVTNSGTVRDSIHTNTINAVWGDATNRSENAGFGGTNDNGCLVLIGTAANPIVISNIVVARGDIYIKGVVKGQGVLYSGRNIYVIGDLTYSNPPSWNHPDSNPSNTASINSTKDFLGLCAKGNLILGNDFKLFLQTLAKAPITHTHAADVMDLEMGYVSYTSNGVPMFNGDYTAIDGPSHNAVRTDDSDRAYYDPMLGETAFQALDVQAAINNIDSVIYANHMLAGTIGKTGGKAFINGSMICRDEVLSRNGNLTLNWDIRAGSRSRDSVRNGLPPLFSDMLPRLVNVYRTVVWTELAP